MKTIIKILAVLGIVLGAVSISPSRAAAGGIWKFKGSSADAGFFSFDGCLYTDVWIFASDNVNQSPPGPAGSSSWTEIWINQWDSCSETTLLSANGGAPLAPEDFQVARKLTAASLTATITVYDWVSDSYMDVAVDLTWTGEGPLSRHSSSYSSSTPGCKYSSRWRGTNRGASISGSIWAGGTNYATLDSWGSIWNVTSGEMAIGCN